MARRTNEVSRLLADWSKGNAAARDELVPLVYDELHRIAGRHAAKERDGHSLQATALVNEVYLRLADQKQIDWKDRVHFFALASRMMRNILVDYARNRRYAKRGGAALHVELDEARVPSSQKPLDVIALDDALNELDTFAPRQRHVVELRYFGGLSIEEIAEVLCISSVTVRRDWATAKAWLYRSIISRS